MKGYALPNPVAPVKASQDKHNTPLFPNPDFYVPGDFTISPNGGFCVNYSSISPTTLTVAVSNPSFHVGFT